LRSFIELYPIAEIKGDITPDVSFRACVEKTTLSSNFDTFAVTLTGGANGSFAVHLSFENKTPPGVGLCHADWAEDFHFRATTTIPEKSLSFAVSSESKGDNLTLLFTAGDQDLLVNFTPAPLEELFGRHPQLLVNCSPIFGAGGAYAAYDTVVNEQAKNLELADRQKLQTLK